MSHNYHLRQLEDILDDLEYRNEKLESIAEKAEHLFQYEKLLTALMENDVKIPESLGEINEMINKLKEIK